MGCSCSIESGNGNARPKTAQCGKDQQRADSKHTGTVHDSLLNLAKIESAKPAAAVSKRCRKADR